MFKEVFSRISELFKKEEKKSMTNYWDVLKMNDPKKIQELLNSNNFKVVEDGIYGPKTKEKHVELLDHLFEIKCKELEWKYTGQANWKSRVRKKLIPDRVVWHWTSSGRTAESLGNLWGSESRAASSHAGVDESGIWWYAPPHRATWHAGIHNENSLGIDICVPPLNNSAGIRNANSRGIYLDVGNSEFQLIHPSVQKQLKSLINELRENLELEFVDHAYVDPGRKIDCIPWRSQLKNLGGYDV